MTPAPRDGVAADAVELLERSLAWTGVALAEVRPCLLDRPTPCAGWRLRDLLAHLEDGLDAFTEAAAGHVAVDPAPLPAGGPGGPDDGCARLRSKAGRLIGAWSRAHVYGGPVRVRIDGPSTRDRRDGPPAVELAADVLVRAAALEVAVHGWDVTRATASLADTGTGTDRAPGLPPALARDLLPAARLLVPREGRAGRFARPTVYRPSTTGRRDTSAELLSWLGR